MRRCAAAGAAPPLVPAALQVWHAGQRIAAELRDGGDGSFDPQDTLRFYAEPPGDRWNATDTYWLTVEAQPGIRMASRPALTGGDATVTTAAIYEGVWRANRLYDTTLPGPDGDHWFAADLRSGPGWARRPSPCCWSATCRRPRPGHGDPERQRLHRRGARSRWWQCDAISTTLRLERGW